MNENELKELWQSSNKKLEESQKLNQEMVTDISKMKVQSLLSTMIASKVFALVIGILWVSFGATIISNLFLYAYDESSKFFLYSGLLQILITALSIIIYLYQLLTILQSDISEAVLLVQERITKLKVSSLWVSRILFLQLPLWTIFYWNEEMFTWDNYLLWIVQGLVTLTFTYAAIWLFINIKIENKDAKWFQLLFNGKEWSPLIRSMEFLEKIQKFKEEEQRS